MVLVSGWQRDATIAKAVQIARCSVEPVEIPQPVEFHGVWRIVLWLPPGVQTGDLTEKVDLRQYSPACGADRAARRSAAAARPAVSGHKQVPGEVARQLAFI